VDEQPARQAVEPVRERGTIVRRGQGAERVQISTVLDTRFV